MRISSTVTRSMGMFSMKYSSEPAYHFGGNSSSGCCGTTSPVEDKSTRSLDTASLFPFWSIHAPRVNVLRIGFQRSFGCLASMAHMGLLPFDYAVYLKKITVTFPQFWLSRRSMEAPLIAAVCGTIGALTMQGLISLRSRGFLFLRPRS